MKKLVALLLVTIMTLSLAACAGGGDSGSSDDSADSGEKKAASGEAMTFFVMGPEDDLFTKPQRDLVKRWNELHPDTPVDIICDPSDTETYYEKLTTAIATGDAPDIATCDDQGVYKLVESGYAMDLTDYVQKEKYDESALESLTFDGKIMAMPMFYDIRVLFCNTAMFKEAGLELPKTWDDMLEAAKKLATKDRYGLYIDVSNRAHELYIDIPFLWAAGGDVMDDDGNIIYDSEETARFLEYMRELAKSGAVNEANEFVGNDETPFGSGMAAMQILTDNRVNTLNEKYPDLEYDVVPIPVPEEGMENVAIIGSWKPMVNKNGKNPEAAAEFVKFMAYENYDILQAAITDVPELAWDKTVYDQVEKELDPRTEFIVENVTPVGRHAPTYDNELCDLFAASVEEAIFTDKDISEIMSETQEKMEAVVNK